MKRDCFGIYFHYKSKFNCLENSLWLNKVSDASVKLIK